MELFKVRNGERFALGAIPVLEYGEFSQQITELLSCEQNHCVNYFALASSLSGKWTLICCVALDGSAEIAVSACRVEKGAKIASASASITALERFEREIAENTDITFEGHPWYKPVRTASDDYPFYHMEGEELHEVGVGPIHAGVIEPGHFRFICCGEKILHLEIMLGYQHRGVEKLFLQKKMLSQRALLAESVAGDTAVGHSVAFAQAWESLSGYVPSRRTQLERMLALEMERMAIHTGDLSAICGDVAYQLGSAVYGRLRTPLINFMQRWSGNRLGKSNVRPFANPYPFTSELAAQLKETINAFERDFNEVSDHIKRFPSVLSRLERTGTVTYAQAVEIGAVGMAAKASGLCRDLRTTHPYLAYSEINHEPVVKHHGDVYSRTQMRIAEVRQSMEYVHRIIGMLADEPLDGFSDVKDALQPRSMVVSLSEGWRGEICHCALTDAEGELRCYKIKDPSFHNWMALALAVRNNEISDFPICNKSFNLSYCGHDL